MGFRGVINSVLVDSVKVSEDVQASLLFGIFRFFEVLTFVIIISSDIFALAAAYLPPLADEKTFNSFNVSFRCISSRSSEH